YGSRGSTFPRPRWGRVTRKETDAGTRLFLLVFDWQAGERLFIPLRNEVVSCRLLADEGRTLTVEKVDQGLSVQLTGEAPDPVCSVIDVQLRGPQALTGANLLRPATDGSILLAAEQATFDGAGQWMGIDLGTRSIHGWNSEKAWVEWVFHVDQPGTLHLSLDVASAEGSACTVKLGEHAREVSIPASGDALAFQSLDAGTLTLHETGDHTLRLEPVRGSWNPVRLRSALLK
ncbi:MAG: hypothetical protein GWO24_16165, partial [Akkermansiaceae bacterium]|nr:hypothetical protein [Akkermansiaceae bacterium]